MGVEDACACFLMGWGRGDARRSRPAGLPAGGWRSTMRQSRAAPTLSAASMHMVRPAPRPPSASWPPVCTARRRARLPPAACAASEHWPPAPLAAGARIPGGAPHRILPRAHRRHLLGGALLGGRAAGRGALGGGKLPHLLHHCVLQASSCTGWPERRLGWRRHRAGAEHQGGCWRRDCRSPAQPPCSARFLAALCSCMVC